MDTTTTTGDVWQLKVGGETIPLRQPPNDPGDFRAFAERLRGRITGEVRFDRGARALYATDGSNYRMPPMGVVLPRSVDDVIRTVEACREAGLPILPRGGGTSLSGETNNTAVVIDFSRHLREILEIDTERRVAVVQPGVVLDHLRAEAGKRGLTFGPDPSTHAYCTLGGMIGNNSCGVHSVLAGKTSDNVESLEILTYDGLRMRVGATSEEEIHAIVRAGGRRGEIYGKLLALRERYADRIRERYPKIPRLVSGFALEQLLPENGFHVARALVGTEGTCVTVLEATCRLVPNPSHRALLVLGYPDIATAADHIPQLMELGPIGLEAFDDVLASDMRKLHIHADALQYFPKGGGWLLFEVGAFSDEEREEKVAKTIAAIQALPDAPTLRHYDDPFKMEQVWKARESGLGATARVPGKPESWEGWEDSAVPPERLGEYLRKLRALYQKHNYNGAFYGHFGQGCVHTRIDFDFHTPEGLLNYHRFMEEATSLCVSLGGSLSGEHGDGQARAEFLPKMFGEDLVEAFREFKRIWDPGEKMNPGKVVSLDGGPPFRTTENLRLGPHFHPEHPKTHFRYPEDKGDFVTAVTRCVGVGLCRRTTSEDGVMCPSFMVTLEEEHTTRGRAHALFEMLHGGVIDDGWKSEEVKRSLDLCLSCKGCKSDCPMGVDMATYKAEFLSHYHAGRLRPRAAYSMGLIFVWARLASVAPTWVNGLLAVPAVAAVAKLLGGISQSRPIPAFAPSTFRQRFRERKVVNPGGRRVILWPDTFNDHFHPKVAMAATEVLEAAGFRVTLPEASVCCGRPLYDYGMLQTAKALLRRTLDVLAGAIDEGVPVIGLEPSCLAVFRDELVNLFPDDERAQKLAKQSVLFSEFLDRHAPDLPLQAMEGKALVQTHCHQHALMGNAADHKLLGRMGLDADFLRSGCCGMAGSFGFEEEKAELSHQMGERVLFPAVRDAPDAWVVADGFSCKTQIEQGTGRRALHLAELARLALPNQRPAPWPLATEPPLSLRWALMGLAAGAGIWLALGARRR